MLRLLGPNRLIHLRKLPLLLMAALAGALSARGQFDPRIVNVDRGVMGGYASLTATNPIAFPSQYLMKPASLVALPVDGMSNADGISFVASKHWLGGFAPVNDLTTSLVNENLSANSPTTPVLAENLANTAPPKDDPATELRNPCDVDFASQLGYFDAVGAPHDETLKYDPTISTLNFHDIYVYDPGKKQILKKIRSSTMPFIFVGASFCVAYFGRRLFDERVIGPRTTLILNDRHCDD